MELKLDRKIFKTIIIRFSHQRVKIQDNNSISKVKRILIHQIDKAKAIN